MALITCPKCGAKISDKALVCPKCKNKIKGSEDNSVNSYAYRTNDKPKLIILSIIFSLIVIFIVLVLFIKPFYHNLSEQDLWEVVRNTTDIKECNEYLRKFPNGEHLYKVEAIKEELEAELTDWEKIMYSQDFETLLKYADSKPDSRYATEARNKASDLLWTQAKQMNNKDMYNRYLEYFPNGIHAKEVNDLLEKVIDTEVNDNDMSIVTNVINNFFRAVENNDEEQLTNSVVPIMSSFLSRKNATKSTAIIYMNSMHADDVYSLNYSISDIIIRKKLLENDNFIYEVHCSVDLHIGRSNSEKPSFFSYTCDININNSLKILKFNLYRISKHYSSKDTKS
jgi:hypothetical protein